MRTYEITIKPKSGFGTPLKGDTIFGHICWQAAYDESLFGKTIDQLLRDYNNNPFIVVSSAFFKIGEGNNVHRIFKRPDMSLFKVFNFKGTDKMEVINKRKILKSKKWLALDFEQKIENFKKLNYFSEEEVVTDYFKNGQKSKNRHSFLLINDFAQPHNTINRLTNTTGEGRFVPFSSEQMVFNIDVMLAIYVGIREDIAISQIKTAFQRIGEVGFGKDASTGLGKFDIVSTDEFNLFEIGSPNPNACYTLSPCIPEKGVFSEIYFTPFTRFGRHGDVLAKSKNPFKNPVLMADEGAVFICKNMNEILRKPYIGKAITGVSKILETATIQGYSLYIPVKVED